MNELRIIGINVMDRIKEAGRTQETLSKYAYLIKTRWGFHELTEATCSRNGFIVLELQGNSKEWDEFENELNNLGGVQVKHMKFNF